MSEESERPRPAGQAAAAAAGGELLGQPKGLYVLFFTELWERFSFYGMKALLILYMVNYLIWSQQNASLVMAWYAGLVYCTPVLGGLLADRLLGARWAVLLGGMVIATGHFLLAFEPLPFFFCGLGCLIIGVGLLKPNISTQVGALYVPGDARRDAAFTIFYMGINIGALLGPIVCARLMEHPRLGFHYGFAAAGVGMVVGLIVYLLGMGSVSRRAAQVAAAGGNAAGGAPGAQSGAPALSRHVQRDRLIVLLVIFLFAVIFWMAFEQAANVMTIWADKHTNLYPFRLTAPPATVETDAPAPAARTWRDFSLTAPDLLSVNPLFIIALAAVFSWLWVWLEKRNRQPSIPSKITLGLLGMTLAYGVMVIAARVENRPSAALLDELPPNVVLGNYGATRLHYDQRNATLRMNGVLTDLDRLRLLGDSAPESYRQAIEELAGHAEQRAGGAAGGLAQVTLPPQAPSPAPLQSLPKSVQWDPQTRTLAASAPLPGRERLMLLAAGAPPDFRAAVDAIYRKSSAFRVTLWWLILFYLLCTMGELCLSPVGLSAVTKMAPARYVGLMMGLWFLFTGGVANFLAHLIGAEWGRMTPVSYFMIFGGLSLAALLLMTLLVPLLKRKMHGIK